MFKKVISSVGFVRSVGSPRLIGPLARLPWPVWLGMAGMIAFGLLVMVRLVDLQVRQGASFTKRADQNRFFAQDIVPERGVLLDRYGQPLVVNRRRYLKLDKPAAVFSTQTALDRETALQLLATQSAIVSVAQTAGQTGGRSSSQSNQLGTVTYQLERVYPAGAALAHVLGYVGAVTADDLLHHSELQPTDLIGKTGLEAAVNDQVQGRHGAQWYEVNALGQKQRLLQQQPAQAGANVVTTLDASVAVVAAQAMGDRQGAVVVFDAQTGAILSLVSLPSFDPNQLQPLPAGPAEIARRQQVSTYFTDPHQILFNRAISGAYPPGSIFKLVTALAGLVDGQITPETTVDDTGVLKVGEYSYANWYFTQYGRTEGPIQLQRALARSNDIYFYKAAEAIGPTKLAEWARRFGLGSKVGLEIGGESAGLVPDPAWKERVIGEKWYLGDTYHYGIGQGDLLVTPVQMAQVLQAVANRGRLCQLHLLDHGKLTCGDLGLTDDQLRPVVAGMVDACSPGGTAFPFFPLNQKALSTVINGQTVADSADPWQKLAAGAVACKTGTAEFGAATNAAGHRATHGWFIMTATLPARTRATVSPVIQDEQELVPAAFPTQIGIVVLVESQPEKPYVEGSADAAPVAKAIYEWLVNGKMPG